MPVQRATSLFDSIARHEALFFLCVAVNVCLLGKIQTPYLCAAPEHAASKPNSLSSQSIVFIGGYPGSGTLLARAMLDAHPGIHCGIESSALPGILSLYRNSYRIEMNRQRLESAGVSGLVMARATRAFVTKIIAGHGDPADKHLCYKGPLLPEMSTLVKLFPKSKFMFMIRDGRAVAHSVISRQQVPTGFQLNISHLSVAEGWNRLINMTIRGCSKLPERCMTVFYEKLVTDPSTQMKEVLRFLDIPWHNDVLRHHELVGSEVSLSE